METSELISQIMPLLLPQIEGMITGASAGGAVPSPHDLNAAHHSGVLADSQAPQFLKTDGSRTLTGNLAVSAGITIDGLDLSAMAAGTVSVTSVNAASLAGTHTHTVAASAAPGVSQSLLKTDATGLLTLQKLTVATAPTISVFTDAGGILHTDGSGVVTQDPLVVIDSANNRIGIGVAVPTSGLHVVGSGASFPGVLVDNIGSSGAVSLLAFRAQAGAGADQVAGEIRLFPKNHTMLVTDADTLRIDSVSATHLDIQQSLIAGDIRLKFGTTTRYVFTDVQAAFDQPLVVGQAATLAGWGLDVYAAGILASHSQVDAATKNARFGTRHYTNAEEPFVPLMFQSTVTGGFLYLGGGLGTGNAATQIRFYLAANNTTLLGTEIARITGSSGLWGIGIGNTVPIAQVDIQSTSENLRLRYNASAYASFNTLSTGSLEIATAGSVAANAVLTLKPAGAVILHPSPSTPTGDVVPNANYRVNLGSLTSKFLTLHAAELWVETLVAQETIATIGGRILVGPTTTLTRDLTAVATQIYVKHNQMVSGDRVYLESNGKIEFLAVTSGPTTISATEYRYNITRNLDTTGANAWNAGDAVFNTGQAGGGWIDLYSVRGMKYTVAGSVKTWSQLGPAVVMNVRNSATFNDWTEHAAFGNLRGIYGYGADTYGVAFGKYSTVAGSTYITIDATNGYRLLNGSTIIGQWAANGVVTVGNTALSHVRIDTGIVSLRTGANDKIVLDAAGNISLVGVITLGSGGGIYQGSGSFGTPTTGLKLWNDGGVGRIGGYNAGVAQWYAGTDGKLYAGAGTVVLDQYGITIDPDGGTNILTFAKAGDIASMLNIYASRGAGASSDQSIIATNDRSGTFPQAIIFGNPFGIRLTEFGTGTQYDFGATSFKSGGLGDFSALGIRLPIVSVVPFGSGTNGDMKLYDSGGGIRRIYALINGTWRYADLT